MSKSPTEARAQDLRILSWLAECQRSRFLAVPLSPEVRDFFEREGGEWARGLCCLDFPLTYEPRSLTVSPDGRKIAIGTKSGEVRLARWDGREWSVASLIRDAQPPGQRRAVRGLCFLGDGLLVAGEGSGVYRPIPLPGAQASEVFHVCHLSPRPAGEDIRFLQFRKILPLFAGTAAPARPDAPLALGLTQGRFLHLLRRHEGEHQAVCMLPEEALGEAWKDVWIVDGQWWRERLWVLDSRGRVHRFREGGEGPFGIEPDEGETSHSFEVPYFRARSDPQSLSICQGGLAVRFGSDVTLVRRTDVERLQAGASIPRDRIRWVEVPGATRCVAFQEFGTQDRVYLAVATSESGLQWIPWPLDDTGVPGPDSLVRRPQVWGQSTQSILEMAAVRPAGQEASIFLTLGTRDHRFRIVSLLNRDIVENHVLETGREEPRLTQRSLSGYIADLHHPEQAAEMRRFLLEEANPGVALRVVRRLINWDLAAAYGGETRASGLPGGGSGTVSEEDVAQFFEKLDLSDLQDIIEHLGVTWKRATALRPRQGVERQSKLPGEVYRRFCLRVFQRASRLDERSLHGLALLVWEHVEDLRRSLPEDEWHSLGLFGSFLRKWFVFGYTYGEKRFGLLQLFEENRQCDRGLDALFYLTRLLKNEVDACWEREVEPTGVSAGISALVPAPAGRFLLHAHLDGRLFATAADGRPVSWAATVGSEEHLAEGRLLIVDNGLALCHANAAEFRQIYRHGPYIRHLYVEEEEPGLFLIVFGVRGWYSSEEIEHGPRLVVLAVRWEDESASLTIQEAVIQLAKRELYGITRLPAREPGEAGITLAIGTGGSLDSPFLEVKVRREAAGLQVDPVVPRLREDLQWKSFETADPSEIRSRLRINLGSSIDALTVPGENGAPPSVWLWLGMHDGRLRSFLWEDGTWLEGGRWSGRPVLDPILTYSPIRTLRCVQAPGGETFLAYGTADGVLGCVPLDRLAAAAGPVPRDHSGEPNQPWLHVIHSRRGSAICGVANYQDGQDWNLAFLTEEGGVILHHLGSAGERWQENRFIHMGMRLDAFRLPVEARGFATLSIATDAWKILEGEETRKTHLPALIVGGNDGTVGQYLLLFPKFSERRGRIAVPRVREIFRHQSVRKPGEESSFIRSAGRESAHPWLRLCDVRESNLAWFSLWHVLQELHQAHLPSRSADGRLHEIPDNLPELVAIYRETLRLLTDEVYGRKPLGIDAAKMLWSETARYANKILEMALQVPDEERQREALRLYNLLLIDLDYLANRWIGADQESEARVLMHSFSDLFDWSGIVLIAQDSFNEELEETRQILLFRVIRRRLRHDDIRVPLEAIRVLNTALLRALVTNGKWQPGWMFVQRPLRPQAHGFRDLLDLVGHLVRQQVGRLTPADPLYTEIARFFALSLLLVPDGILSVGQVICETRLVEYQMDVGRRILLHAQRLQHRLAKDFVLGGDVELRLTTLVGRFAQFLSRKVDFEIDQFPLDTRFDPKSEQPWRGLLSEPEAPDAPPLHDRHYLAEYRKVLFTVSRLARLSPLENAPPDDEVFRWLDPGQEVSYFQGSQRYLRSLREQRKELLNLLHTASPQRGEIAFSFEQRELEIDEQPDLVEPLKTYYRQILAQWRRELDRRGQQAIDLVELIDRFNRHVYRTSADDLMANLVELAMRSAPMDLQLALEREPDLPLWLQIRERVRADPFVSELFRRGSLLVQRSHLAGTLLYLATLCLGRGNRSDQPMSERFTLEKIREKAVEVARLEGVQLQWSPPLEDLPRIPACPGDEIIWGTILRELARNVYDYCSVPQSEAATPFRVVWQAILLAGGERVWCLSVGSDAPFFASLPENLREEIGIALDPAGALLLRVRAILDDPGIRYQTEREGSFGFGLYLLRRLFDLSSRARADLLLLHPEANLNGHVAVSDGRPKLSQPFSTEFLRLAQMPLTMVFSWKVEA